MPKQSVYKKPCIVITRPEPGLSETATKIRSLGWVPILMPVMTIKTLPMNDINLCATQGIIFTSRQAIAPTIQVLKNHSFNFERFPVFTVGDITAKAAMEAGFKEVTSAGKDAIALAKLVENSTSPKYGKFLFPSAKGQGSVLCEKLRNANFEIEQYEVYETPAVSQLSNDFLKALEKKMINSILFFSSESTRYFVELIPEPLKPYFSSLQAIGISVKTQKFLSQLSWGSVEIAREPKTEEMLSLIKEHF